jgi:hypothetical protein
MSIWDAVTCAPRRLRRLNTGDEFNQFCSLGLNGFAVAWRPGSTGR